MIWGGRNGRGQGGSGIGSGWSRDHEYGPGIMNVERRDLLRREGLGIKEAFVGREALLVGLGIHFSKELKRVDAGVVAVGPEDGEGVVADLLDIEDFDGAVGGGLDPLGGAAGVALAVGAGAITAQVDGGKDDGVIVVEDNAQEVLIGEVFDFGGVGIVAHLCALVLGET